MSEKTVAGKLASELAERNLQETMKETSSFDYANFDMFEETDEKLATMIFNFLTGRSDELPDRSMVEEVRDSANPRRSIMSINCGVFVSKDMQIEAIDVIEPDIERVDTITDEDHVVSISNYTDHKLSKETTDRILTTPRFEEDRVAQLQEFIKSYHSAKTR